MTNKFTDEQKIAFFDHNWGYLNRIMDSAQKLNIRPGRNVFEAVAEILDGLLENINW